MNSSPSFPFIERRRRGEEGSFTLTEVLVAVAILSFLVLILAQMASVVSNGWHRGRQQADNFGRGRAMLELLARDLKQSVVRADVPFWPNAADSRVAFYTLRQGISLTGSSSSRDLSLVFYDISDQSVLERGNTSFPWSGASAPVFTNSPSQPTRFDPSAITYTNSTVPGVVACKLLFVQSNGLRSFVNQNFTVSSSGTNSVVAVGVTMAVVDSQTYNLILGTGGLGKLRDLGNALTSAATTNGSVKADWENYLKGPGMDWSRYPKQLATGIKVFERYVAFPAPAQPQD